MRHRSAVSHSRLQVSMVSLKWGDVLSAVLPGAVAVFAIAPWFPPFWKLVTDINNAQLATGIAFLFASALAGGVLEGMTRVGWEQLLRKWCKSPDVLPKLTPVNLPLYERGVDSSYKYVTFYSNLAHASVILSVTCAAKSRGGLVLLLAVITALLLIASYVQWTYYVNYQKKVF